LLYVYALLGSEPRDLPACDAGVPLRIIRCGEISAAVTSAGDKPALSEANIVLHDRVVRALAATVDAILPARFGSMVEDEIVLAELLRRREPELQRALGLVKGREQMTLRIYEGTLSDGASECAGDEPGHQQRAVMEGGPGTRYLIGKKRREESLMRRLEGLRLGLETFVRAESMQHHNKPPLFASVYHLIDRGQSAEYLSALDLLMQYRDDYRISATGPWPPYAFGQWKSL
jgi:hypothetical protein